jgi:hypothetical protein
MKNPLAKVALRLEKASEGTGDKADFASIAGGLLRLARFVASRPLWTYRVYAGSKRMAIYHVTFGKQTPIKVLLAQSTAEVVMSDRSEEQGAVQHVWQQACAEVNLDPRTYTGVKVPHLHVWRNLDANGDYVVGLQWHRDATARERKLAGVSNPLREFVSGYIKYVAPLD